MLRRDDDFATAMEAVSTSETSVSFYQTTLSDILAAVRSEISDLFFGTCVSERTPNKLVCS
jgi:hypothetical protein